MTILLCCDVKMRAALITSLQDSPFHYLTAAVKSGITLLPSELSDNNSHILTHFPLICEMTVSYPGYRIGKEVYKKYKWGRERHFVML
jgi:hypothetical protein